MTNHRSDHSSRSRLAPGLQQPTRGLIVLRHRWRKTYSAPLRDWSNGPSRPSPPIWPCTTRGLPCHSGYPERGELLPHLFTLTMREDQEHAIQMRRDKGFAFDLPPRWLARRMCEPAVLFSVALSVAVSFRDRPPGVTRRRALQLSGLAAFHWVSGLSSRALQRQRSPGPPAKFILT